MRKQFGFSTTGCGDNDVAGGPPKGSVGLKPADVHEREFRAVRQPHEDGEDPQAKLALLAEGMNHTSG